MHARRKQGRKRPRSALFDASSKGVALDVIHPTRGQLEFKLEEAAFLQATGLKPMLLSLNSMRLILQKYYHVRNVISDQYLRLLERQKRSQAPRMWTHEVSQWFDLLRQIVTAPEGHAPPHHVAKPQFANSNAAAAAVAPAHAVADAAAGLHPLPPAPVNGADASGAFPANGPPRSLPPGLADAVPAAVAADVPLHPAAAASAAAAAAAAAAVFPPSTLPLQPADGAPLPHQPARPAEELPSSVAAAAPAASSSSAPVAAAPPHGLQLRQLGSTGAAQAAAQAAAAVLERAPRGAGTETAPAQRRPPPPPFAPRATGVGTRAEASSAASGDVWVPVVIARDVLSSKFSDVLFEPGAVGACAPGPLVRPGGPLRTGSRTPPPYQTHCRSVPRSSSACWRAPQRRRRRRRAPVPPAARPTSATFSTRCAHWGACTPPPIAPFLAIPASAHTPHPARQPDRSRFSKIASALARRVRARTRDGGLYAPGSPPSPPPSAGAPTQAANAAAGAGATSLPVSAAGAGAGVAGRLRRHARR